MRRIALMLVLVLLCAWGWLPNLQPACAEEEEVRSVSFPLLEVLRETIDDALDSYLKEATEKGKDITITLDPTELLALKRILRSIDIETK